MQELVMIPLLGFEDLALTVVAAIAAHAMGQFDLAALRARRTGGHSENAIGAATRVGTSTTGLLLRHCHGFPSPYPLDRPSAETVHIHKIRRNEIIAKHSRLRNTRSIASRYFRSIPRISRTKCPSKPRRDCSCRRLRSRRRMRRRLR